MIEAAKEILEMVKHAPEYVLWVLAGLLFYKVVIIGSWFGIARLLITKGYDLLAKPKEIKHTLNGICITSDSTVSTLTSALHMVRMRNKDRAGAYVSDYIHDSDAHWLTTAIQEKIQREKDGAKNL